MGRQRSRAKQPGKPAGPSGAVPGPWSNSRWAVLLAAGLIVLAAMVAYRNSLDGGFVFDDLSSVRDNPTIRQLWPLGPVLSPPSRGDTVSGRPLLNLSFALNYASGGTAVEGYHATNVAIHILAALLLLGILRRTFLLPALCERFGRAATPLALSIALIWTLHPLQTESVAYVVQRAESLVAMFYLLTLYCVIRGAGSGEPCTERTNSMPWLWYAGAVLACVLGMASKEVMVTAPLVVLLYDRTLLAGSFAEALRRRWGLYVALAATWGLLAYLVISTGLMTQGPDIRPPPDRWSYAFTQPGVILHYLRLSVWPYPLCNDYFTWPLATRVGQVLPGVVVLGMLAAATLWGFVRRKAWSFLGVWFFLILSPTSSIVSLADLAVEHRMYLPLAAVVTALVLGGYAVCQALGRAGWAPQSKVNILAVGLLAVVCIVLGRMTYLRNRVYHDEISFGKDAIAKAPENLRALDNLAATYHEQWQIDHEQWRLDQAIVYYRRVLAIDPDYASTHHNLGKALWEQGVAQSDPRKLDEAILHFQKALQTWPERAWLHCTLAEILLQRQRFQEATAALETCLKLDPQHAEAHCHLGDILRQGDIAGALAHYERAIEINPGYADARYHLGFALQQQGKVGEAIAQWREILRQYPNNLMVLNETALVLATSADAAVRNGKEAVVLAERAVQKAGGSRNPVACRTLAVAYAASGRFSDAVQTAQQALALAEAQNNTAVANVIRADLEVYQAGRAIGQPQP
jgi:protein O-mannosyl-transferase